MKWYRPLAIIKKELWEYRKQKYILYSILFPPIIFAILLPLLTFAPLTGLLSNVDHSIIDQYTYPATNLSLNPTSVDSYVSNHSVNGLSFISSAELVDINLLHSEIASCVIDNCTVRDYRINRSIVRDCTITAGVIRDSLLLNVTLKSSIIINCSGLNVNIYDSSTIRSQNLEVVSKDGFNNRDLFLTLIDSYTFLMIMMPAITPTVIASYTFVGEKNNKSLEPLLATPATDSELLWGKILAILIPTMGATFIGFFGFAFASNIILTGPLGYAPFPNFNWLASMLLLSPLMCFLAITANIIISSKMSDVRASQQVGSLVVLPILLLFIGQFTGIMSLGASPVMLVAALLIIMDVVIFLLAKKAFRRENILVNWK